MLSLFTVLNPQGAIGLAERGLMIHAVEFMLIVALPVYFLLFFFAYQYRAGNKKAKYLPNWEHGKLEELVWWAIPLEIVLVLGALTWGSTHALDPGKPLDAARGEPLVVQVVALEWKWLFIYPTQGIATVNYLKLPVGRPVRFEVTAQAPMNSFLIPELGGQIYAMTGMSNDINLIADKAGSYRGISANYSGVGFAQMSFTANAVPQTGFDDWVVVTQARAAATPLTFGTYQILAKPGVVQVPPVYGAVEAGLYERILMQFADQSGSMTGMHM
jgi:cytochrome o ubiquinol oxidase subunit 2